MVTYLLSLYLQIRIKYIFLNSYLTLQLNLNGLWLLPPKLTKQNVFFLEKWHPACPPPYKLITTTLPSAITSIFPILNHHNTTYNTLLNFLLVPPCFPSPNNPQCPVFKSEYFMSISIQLQTF